MSSSFFSGVSVMIVSGDLARSGVVVTTVSAAGDWALSGVFVNTVSGDVARSGV